MAFAGYISLSLSLSLVQLWFFGCFHWWILLWFRLHVKNKGQARLAWCDMLQILYNIPYYPSVLCN